MLRGRDAARRRLVRNKLHDSKKTHWIPCEAYASFIGPGIAPQTIKVELW